ncbi:MAG: CTP synthase [bacterium]|nr:CTP synthase [bacterium]
MKKSKETKYIFVAGGVMSGIGKGITASSVAKILQARGFTVSAMKIDPYVNVDAGTMNPVEHGEVFVLSDGLETDQDLGNYERFLDINLYSVDYMTTGSLYLSIIQKERNLGYKGKCVQVVPEVPNAVIEKIEKAAAHHNSDFVVIEIGGTVGEYENILFLEAYRMLKNRSPENALFILVSYLPLQKDGELKTKPTQIAVRSAYAVGIQPDIIVARAEVPMDKVRKEKIAINCGLEEADVISAPNVENIYEVPLNFEKDGLGNRILEKFGMSKREAKLSSWKILIKKIDRPGKEIAIGIVGKYFEAGEFTLTDSYISVIEAVKHASYAAGVKVNIKWLNSGDFSTGSRAFKQLNECDGIIVPGGFGSRGVDGKINVIQHCRENKIPYLGLCYGMQLAVVEFARNVVGLKGAHTTEINKQSPYPVIAIMDEQRKKIDNKDYGGTMRLGDYKAKLKSGTKIQKLYKKSSVVERHRHRYEVNPEYISEIESKGLIFSGSSPNGKLMEFIEFPEKMHPYFVGTQAHPEFLSRPLKPHPLFLGLIQAATKRKK